MVRTEATGVPVRAAVRPELSPKGVMLGTSALQLQLYRLTGDLLDRTCAARIVVSVIEEYMRGEPR